MLLFHFLYLCFLSLHLLFLAFFSSLFLLSLFCCLLSSSLSLSPRHIHELSCPTPEQVPAAVTTARVCVGASLCRRHIDTVCPGPIRFHRAHTDRLWAHTSTTVDCLVLGLEQQPAQVYFFAYPHVFQCCMRVYCVCLCVCVYACMYCMCVCMHAWIVHV
jgi:hypothetical protein